MKAVSILNEVPETKAEIKTWVKIASSEIRDGYVNPLQIEAKLKAMEEAIKQLRAEIKEDILDAGEKYGKKSFEDFGVKFQIKETGVQYNFKSCDDPIWDHLNDEINSLMEQKKEREAFLKTVKPGAEIYNGKDGAEIKPSVRSSKTTIVTLLK